MKRIASIIQQIELAQSMLAFRYEQQQLQLSQEYLLDLLASYQKVSLAEKAHQVKNGCSHMSSVNEENLIH